MNTRDVKKVLVVGGAGYLGSVLVGKLLDHGYPVRVLDMLMFGGASLEQYQDRDNFELVVGDIRSIPVVTRAIQDVTAVIHLAAIVGDPACKQFPSRTVETNYLASKMLAEACKYHQVNRFIYASTCSVYGIADCILTEESPTNPISLYAQTKISSEKAILEMADDNFSPCSMRMSTLHGWSPRMRFDLVVNTMTMHAVKKGLITVQGGKQWRPLMHVADAANAYVKSLSIPLKVVGGQVFNVGSPSQNFQIINLARLVERSIPKVRCIIEPQVEDARNYRVSFQKMEQRLHFQPKYTVENSIVEISSALKKDDFIDVNDDRYYNHNEAF